MYILGIDGGGTASSLRLTELHAVVLSGGMTRGSAPLRKQLLRRLSREPCAGAVSIAHRLSRGQENARGRAV